MILTFFYSDTDSPKFFLGFAWQVFFYSHVTVAGGKFCYSDTLDNGFVIFFIVFIKLYLFMSSHIQIDEPTINISAWSFLTGSWNGVWGSDPEHHSEVHPAAVTICLGRHLFNLDKFLCHLVFVITQSI